MTVFQHNHGTERLPSEDTHAICKNSILKLAEKIKSFDWQASSYLGALPTLHQEQLSFFEFILPDNARFKAVASISDDGFSQEFHLPQQVPQAVARVMSDRNNAYLSLCDYVQPRRAGEYVFGFTAFGFDIDCHTSDQPILDSIRAYEHLKECFFDSKGFPQPSLVEHTGRGLLVVVAFKRAPKQVLPLWLRMGESWAQRLREVLPPYAILDDTYNDVARVVRVPDSYNVHVDKHSYILEQHLLPLPELSALRDRYFPELSPTHQKSKGNRSFKKRDNLIYTDGSIKLHVDRLDDLIRLIELRAFKMDGLRETTLFLYRYWTCFYMAPESALQAALELNGKFTCPLSAAEVTGATRSAEKAFQRWKVDKQTGYNYRNNTLIRLLKITPEEQIKLRTVISKEEKAKRRSVKKQWGNERRDDQRVRKKNTLYTAIANLIRMEVSCREICRVLRCSDHTVTKVRNLMQDGIM